MFLWVKKFKEKRLLKKTRSLLEQRKNHQLSAKQSQEELYLLNQLANLYGQLQKYHNDYPYALEMQVNTYRNIAELGDKNAYFYLAKELLRHAKACEQWQNNEVLANRFNQAWVEQYYAQAHQFLQLASAENSDALRLLGLCYIHGWGFEIDRKKGFSLLIDSINRDNSWDKLPEIFAKLGLNKPEFLSELIKFRTANNPNEAN